MCHSLPWIWISLSYTDVLATFSVCIEVFRDTMSNVAGATNTMLLMKAEDIVSGGGTEESRTYPAWGHDAAASLDGLLGARTTTATTGTVHLLCSSAVFAARQRLPFLFDYWQTEFKLAVVEDADAWYYRLAPTHQRQRSCMS